MVLSTTMPQASIQMDPFSQYGGLLGFLMGGGLNSLFGGQGQGQTPPRPQLPPQVNPQAQSAVAGATPGAAAAQQAMAIQNTAANNAASAVAGGPIGDFSPRPPAAAGGDYGGGGDTAQQMLQAPQAPQQQPMQQQNPMQNPLQQQNPMQRIAQALQGQGGLGGLGGMGGLGGVGAGQQSPLQQMQSALNPTAGMTQNASQLRPSTPNYSGTGANPAVMQAYANAAMQPGRFGGPMGPAGLNPYAMLQRRIAGAGMSPMQNPMQNPYAQNPYSMMG